MSLSKDIKMMINTLKHGGNVGQVIACLEKWDKVHDKFYADCARPTPLRIRKGCPCFKAQEDETVDVSFRYYPRICDHCKEEGYHDEDRCGWMEKYGCQRVDADPLEEAIEEAAETFADSRRRS